MGRVWGEAPKPLPSMGIQGLSVSLTLIFSSRSNIKEDKLQNKFASLLPLDYCECFTFARHVRLLLFISLLRVLRLRRGGGKVLQSKCLLVCLYGRTSPICFVHVACGGCGHGSVRL